MSVISQYWHFVYVNPRNANIVIVELDFVAHPWGTALDQLADGFHLFPIACVEFDGAGVA